MSLPPVLRRTPSLGHKTTPGTDSRGNGSVKEKERGGRREGEGGREREGRGREEGGGEKERGKKGRRE